MSDPKQYNEDLEDEVEPVIIIDGVEQHDGPSGRVEKDGRFMETILTEPGKRYQTKDGEWHDRRPRHRRLMRKINNDQQKAKFLVLLQAGATPSEAAEAIGSSGTTAYGWRNHDAEFRAAWAAAIKTQEGFEQAITGLDLEKEADRRAIQGVGEPVYFKGEVVGHVQKYSDNLLQFRLKGIYPDKYNPRGGVVAINNQPINVTVGTEQAREFTERMLKGEGT